MAQRRFHYDLAFEHYLRANRLPYISVDEAKRSLTPKSMDTPGPNIKSFDFVVYSEVGPNLLVDVKGRKHAGTTGTNLQNWVTNDDIKGLTTWSHIFGQEFMPIFVFLFWCDVQPPDSLFHDLFEHNERWYAAVAITLEDYKTHMKARSAAWDTVCLPAANFKKISRPLRNLLHDHHTVPEEHFRLSTE
ncbi:HYExAFE family protein [Poriferisphaera sp. WC338]|uniref:HYExAFE family protein n=1 Tax=Poriferisphaera sp. WC338 TaxID=3425129 RepID=UPI003D81A8C6